MSYPPPPGTNSLPARPPASKTGFRPAFASTSNQNSSPNYAYTNSAPPRAPTFQHGSSYSSFPNGSSSGVTQLPAQGYSYPQQSQESYGPQSYAQQTYGAAPQIKNPFPVADGASAGSEYDPDMAAQIAQWQSAYLPRETVGKDGKPVTSDAPRIEVPVATTNLDKKKTVVREGGGKKWTDDSLLEWDPSHLRLFVGNLAGETTDDSLLKAFARWTSVQKARVIRDKRTNKSKGYGFVSFSDADDFFQAAKEMNNKYIQSHPVVVRKANTEIKVSNVKERDRNGKRNKNHRDRQASTNEHALGPKPGSGVTKPGQKTKNGLRLLG